MPDSAAQAPSATESVVTEKDRAGTRGGDPQTVPAGVTPVGPDAGRLPARNPSRRRGPSEILIYRDWCKACGICIEFCPTRVFEIGDGGVPVIAHPEKCVSCDLCELLCPDFAITLHRPDDGGSGDGD